MVIQINYAAQLRLRNFLFNPPCHVQAGVWIFIGFQSVRFFFGFSSRPSFMTRTHVIACFAEERVRAGGYGSR